MLKYLLNFISSMLILFHLQTPVINQQVLASTNIHQPTITLTPSPTLTPPPSPTPTKSSLSIKQILIDCTGPDGKHLRTTQQTCVNFNNAWHNQISITPTGAWTTAVKVGDHTYTLQYTPDSRQATTSEIFQALNTYRQANNISPLSLDSKLTNYAQTRADFYQTNGKLDDHAGFLDYVNNQNGFVQLGFNKLGENAAFAGPLTGTHIIENVFGSDTEHNTNQLNPSWTYAGIGINGEYIDIIFGGEKR